MLMGDNLRVVWAKSSTFSYTQKTMPKQLLSSICFCAPDKTMDLPYWLYSILNTPQRVNKTPPH